MSFFVPLWEFKQSKRQKETFSKGKDERLDGKDFDKRLYKIYQRIIFLFWLALMSNLSPNLRH